MAIKTINVGNVVNDGSGDDLRTAFVKVNDNFTELVNMQGEDNTASNVGTGVGLFKEKVGSDLRFKSLVSGTGIGLTSDTNTITISNADNQLVNQINSLLNSYDFGGIQNKSNNVIEFILQAMTFDFGSILSPASFNLDCGVTDIVILSEVPNNLTEFDSGGASGNYTYQADSGSATTTNYTSEFDGGLA
jgi:hypothetical protein